MQFNQSEIYSRIICKATYMYMYDSVNIHCNMMEKRMLDTCQHKYVL